MRDPIIHELLNDAITKWVAVTGVKPGARSFKRGEYDLVRLLEDLRSTQELDFTGLSTFMLLRGAAEEYLKELKIDALDFLADPIGVEATIAPLRNLRSVLENERVVEIIDDFLSSLRKAAKHYGLAASLDKLLADKLHLAYVRRDALRSIETLTAHQFVHGKAGSEPLKYNREIFEFWNINSLLKAMQQQPVSGITLCMIRDPEVLFSFFAITVRNGESLTVLTDRPEVPHPDHKYMTRSRASARSFESRLERHRFPYELLDLEVSADGKALFAKQSKALVPLNTSATKLSTIDQLCPDSFVWLVLLFDLIAERYGSQNLQLPAPAYTGEMLVRPHTLVGPDGALVQSGVYKPLTLPALDGSMVTHKTTADQWELKPLKHNRWLVERYASQVPDVALNTIGDAKEIAAQVQEGLGVDSNHDEDIALRSMDPLSFGTEKELIRDRLWVARQNQIAIIQSLANREYDETRKEVMLWYRDVVAKRVGTLLDNAAIGSMKLPSKKERHGRTFSRQPIEKHTVEGLVQLIGEKNRPYAGIGDYLYLQEHNDESIEKISPHVLSFPLNGGVGISGGVEGRNHHCYEEPHLQANVFSVITPDCAEALVEICGLKSVKELPWQLQRWMTVEPYTGNDILCRLDPEECSLENPWKKLTLRVVIYSSRRSLNARRKKLNLTKKEWIETNDDV